MMQVPANRFVGKYYFFISLISGKNSEAWF
jgi:hypothetical protein